MSFYMSINYSYPGEKRDAYQAIGNIHAPQMAVNLVFMRQ